MLLTTWNIGFEDQFTTIYPANDNGTGANIEIFWGGDHLGFSDSYYYFDFNGGTGAFSQDLGTNPFIKFIGSTGDDMVRNNSGNGVGDAVELTAYGYGGNDEFYGGQEYDKFFGGPGNDKLYGYGGDDVLYGGDATDNDELYGGTGEDRFYVASDGTNSGKDQVKDKRGLDSRIHFVDTTVSEVEFGVTWSPKAWTDSEIEVFDIVLNDFHDTTGNERLNQESNEGGDLYFRRLGTNSGSTSIGAWSNAKDTSTYPDVTFAGGDPQTKVFVAHEVLGHNYDRPTTNSYATAFQAISGWTRSVPEISISYAEWTAPNPGWVKSDTSPFNGWYFNPGNNTKQTLFARDYGASAPFEDFATTAEAWYASEFANNQPAWFYPLVATKQANLDLLFDKLTLPTTPSDLTIDQSFNINRPIFKWDSLVADGFHVQIKDASNNLIREDWTDELTFPLTADLPAGKYTFLVSSMTIEEQESLMASINFTVNHAPQWTAGVQPPPLARQDEDDRLAYGTTVASLAAAASDVDPGAVKGIAISSAPTDNGQWQITRNGGSSWSVLPETSRGNARLLPANGTQSRVRFVPNQNFNGSVQLGYYAWDQTQGTAGTTFNISTDVRLGGTTAFSTGVHYASLTVTPVNDAPAWPAGVQPPALTGISEDNFVAWGTAIATLAARMTDVDAGAVKGIAISSAPTDNGRWQITLNGGSSWSILPATSRGNARLLPADGTQSRVRFVPNQDFNGSVQLGYFAWDQTQGTAGTAFNISTDARLGGATAFSTGIQYASLTVSPVNDAPVWATSEPPALNGINEDNLTSWGTPIASLTVKVNDVDAASKKGIAVYDAGGLDSGYWQFTLDGGNKWNTFASSGYPRMRGNALLLPANSNLSRVRFVPKADFNGTVTLGFYAWDQTQGTAGGNFNISTDSKLGGSTAFSGGAHGGRLIVSPVNDAPEWVANSPSPALNGINEDNFTSSGTTIASLTAGVRDVDAGALKGIAVFRAFVPIGPGRWQYTLNGGTTWVPFSNPTNPASSSNALLLPANGSLSRVRFVPFKDFNGVLTLGYYAWDQTQGTAGSNINLSTAGKVGGATAFSTGVHYSSLTVSPVNDAPEWVAGSPSPDLNKINEDNVTSSGTLIASLAANMNDVDAGALKGIAITSANVENGYWQFTLNGGNTWSTFASAGHPRTTANALLLTANGNLSRVRFVPNRDFNGQVQIGYFAWDQTQGTAGGTFNISTAAKVGGTTAFSTGVHYSSLIVNPMNDAPVISGVGGTVVYPYAASPIFLAPGASVTDIDGGYFNYGRLEVKGASSLDILGLGAGFTINYSRNTVSYGSLSNIVGTIKVDGATKYDGKGGRALIVNFKYQKVTPQIAGQMIASITFGFDGLQGYLPNRTISFTLSDGSSTAVQKMVVKVQK